MSALSLMRVARRAVGMAPQPTFPNLESLLEEQSQEAHNDFRVLANVLPAVVGFVGIVIFCAAGFRGHPLFFLGALAFLAAASALWLIFDRLDKAIPQPRKRLRKLAVPIWSRYSGVYNLVGVEPAISGEVASVLEEGAGIYLKHSGRMKAERKTLGESQHRAVLALEAAMARLLELAEPPTAGAQELALAAGWAAPLLQEMRETDQALDRHARLGSETSGLDALAGLREARLELQNVESALHEFERNRL